jgi:nucleotide-binding universal stress UspA family protein
LVDILKVKYISTKLKFMGWNFKTKEIPVQILICTDGSIASLQSAVLVHKLIFPTSTQVVILGVSEKPADLDPLTSSSSQLQAELKEIYQTTTKIRTGTPYEEILAEALEFSYDLVAVGGAGKHLGILNLQLGSTTSRLARKLHTHFLVAREVPAQINKVLVCLSGEAATGDTIKIGGAWISHSAREVTLLHVTPSKKSVPVSKIKNLTTHQNLPQTQAPVDSGVFEQAVQQLQQAGVTVPIATKIRSGLIVDEVLDELSQGSYDLMVVGAHYQPGKNRWHGLLLDDITDQLLNRSSCSVMII